MNKSPLTIQPEDLITFSKTGDVFIGGELLVNKEIKALQEEIKFLEKTRIWKILTETLTETARQVMFEKAQTFDDMRVGKAILYSNDVKKRILAMIKRVKVGEK